MLRSVAPSFLCVVLLSAKLAVGQTAYPNNTIVSRVNDTTGNCSSDKPFQGTQNVVVGQPIKITGCAPQGGPTGQLFIETNSWTGATNAGFTVTEDADQNFLEVITENLVPSCTVAPSCDWRKFYFVLPGDYSLIYRGDGTTDASVTFHVTAPTPDAKGKFMIWNELLVQTFQAPTQVTPEKSILAPFLGLGFGNSPPGIRFTVTGTPPATTGGWNFVQILTGVSVSHLTESFRIDKTLATGVDTSYPYGNASPVGNGVAQSAQDSPGTYLDSQSSPEGQAAENFSATMYLLWDPGIPKQGDTSCTIAHASFSDGQVFFSPSTCDSIPVPVQSLDWGWCANAIKTLNSNQVNALGVNAGSWYESSRCYYPVQAGRSGYPIWTFTASAKTFKTTYR